MKKRILSLLILTVMLVGVMPPTGVSAVVCGCAEEKSGAVQDKKNMTSVGNLIMNSGGSDTETEIIVIPTGENKRGDANGSGKIDTADATAILKYVIHEGTVDTTAADADKNGRIDTADATAILKYVIHEYTLSD